MFGNEEMKKSVAPVSSKGGTVEVKTMVRYIAYFARVMLAKQRKIPHVARVH
jgi:hypothetical protein